MTALRVAPALLALLFLSCDAGRADPATDADAVPADSLQTPAAAVSADRLIGPDGIAHARRGMTIGALRAALPAGVTLTSPHSFMVDIDAMSVVQDGDTLYHVLIAGGEPAGDDAGINLVGTMNHAFRTAQGVGPGTSLRDAARIYGPPRLSYNTNDESREYAVFPDAPRNILMRVSPYIEDGVFAGIYRTESEYNETTEYDPAAIIAFMMVDLRPMPDAAAHTPGTAVAAPEPAQ